MLWLESPCDLLAFVLWKTWFFVCLVAYFLQKESATSYFFAYSEFMAPKRTTRDSFSAYFDVATDPENKVGCFSRQSRTFCVKFFVNRLRKYCAGFIFGPDYSYGIFKTKRIQRFLLGYLGALQGGLQGHVLWLEPPCGLLACFSFPPSLPCF